MNILRAFFIIIKHKITRANIPIGKPDGEIWTGDGVMGAILFVVAMIYLFSGADHPAYPALNMPL